MIMKFFLLSSMFFFCVAAFAVPEIAEYKGPCRLGDGNGRCEIPVVSFINLIATPERFHNRKVVLVGYVRTARNDASLGFVRDSLPRESIRLVIEADEPVANTTDQPGQKLKERLRKYQGKAVIVEGIFDMMNTGKGGVYAGTLHHLTQVDAY